MSKAKKYPVIILFVLILSFLMSFMLFLSHVSFQKRIVGVMQATAAQDLGLLPRNISSGPLGPKRVWIAEASDGTFEFRSAWPIIGSVPFDIFGSGTTDTDLLAECERLGENVCQPF